MALVAEILCSFFAFCAAFAYVVCRKRAETFGHGDLDFDETHAVGDAEFG